MSYNETTKILTFKTEGGKKIALNGNGDLQKALSRNGVMSHLQLVCDVDDNNTRVNKINIWAKYKPFRDATIFTDFYSDTNSARLSALRTSNFGLDVITADGSTLNNSSIAGAFKQIWTYYPPRAGQDPARVFDFDGYHAEKVLPIQSLGDITFYQALMSQYDFTPAYNNNAADVRLIDLTANALNGWYVGVAFAKNAQFTGTLMYKTASTAIPSSGSTAPAFPTLSAQDITDLKNGNYTHYFMFATDTAKTSFNGSVSGALFRCLPRESTSEMTGQFTISNRMVSAISITKAAFTSNPASANIYVDMSNYTGGGASYYNIGVNYFLNIAVSITALSDIDTVLTKSELTASLSTTFAGGAPAGLVISTMRNSSFTSQNTITIPAGTTQTVYLTIGSNAVLAINAQGQVITGVTPGQNKNVEINLYQRGANFATVNLRLSN